MKYMCQLNGKQYEVLVEKVDDFTPLTYEQTANVPVTPNVAAPEAVVSPSTSTAPVPAPKVSAVTGRGETIIAPLPGNILEVYVSIGQTIAAGDVVLTMEAMKMENELVDSKGGTVSQVCIKVGDTVNTDDILIILD